MEVNIDNFKSAFPKIQSSLSNCAFYTVSGKFMKDPQNYGPNATTPYDTPAEFYAKIRRRSLEFLLLQMGLSIFQFNDIDDTFTYSTFSFRLSPHSTRSIREDIKNDLFESRQNADEGRSKSYFNVNKLFETIDKEKQIGLDELEREKIDSDKVDLLEACMFYHVINILSKSRKPMVAYHMMRNLCGIVQLFVDPLPEKYKHFKEIVRKMFPNIIDLRQLISSNSFRSKVPLTVNSLPILFQKVQSLPLNILNIVRNEDMQSYNFANDWQLQDVISETVAIGICYQTAANMLAFKTKPKVLPVLPKRQILAEHFNKVQLPKLKYTYLNLNGPDPEVDRSNVFHMTHYGYDIPTIKEMFGFVGDIEYFPQGVNCGVIEVLNRENTFLVNSFVDSIRGRSTYYEIIPYSEYMASRYSNL